MPSLTRTTRSTTASVSEASRSGGNPPRRARSRVIGGVYFRQPRPRWPAGDVLDPFASLAAPGRSGHPRPVAPPRYRRTAPRLPPALPVIPVMPRSPWATVPVVVASWARVQPAACLVGHRAPAFRAHHAPLHLWRTPWWSTFVPTVRYGVEVLERRRRRVRPGTRAGPGSQAPAGSRRTPGPGPGPGPARRRRRTVRTR